MIRGFQRNVVVVRTKESRLFDTAYLVLRAREPAAVKKNEMIDEANRLLSRLGLTRERNAKARGRWHALLLFALGMGSGAGLSCLFFLLGGIS